MQISKELLTKELEGMRARKIAVEAQVNQITGASLLLEGLLAYLNQEEPKEENAIHEGQANELEPKPDPNFISEENAKRQEEDEARALSMQEFAELVAGDGATAEEPQPYEEREFYPHDYD